MKCIMESKIYSWIVKMTIEKISIRRLDTVWNRRHKYYLKIIIGQNLNFIYVHLSTLQRNEICIFKSIVFFCFYFLVWAVLQKINRPRDYEYVYVLVLPTQIQFFTAQMKKVLNLSFIWSVKFRHGLVKSFDFSWTCGCPRRQSSTTRNTSWLKLFLLAMIINVVLRDLLFYIPTYSIK